MTRLRIVETSGKMTETDNSIDISMKFIIVN